MSARFAIHPPEVAYDRHVLFAVELLDPLTLAPVSAGITVTATGLSGKPIVNLSGQFVWLQERGAQAQRVQVDPGATRYEAEDLAAPLPPTRLLRAILRPRPGYDIGSGVTAIRSSLYESIAAAPVPVARIAVWLQWLDDGAAVPTWTDAAPRNQTADDGGFVALLRLSAASVPALDAAGRLRARLQFDRAGTIRTSPELQLKQGRTADLAPFAWDQL